MATRTTRIATVLETNRRITLLEWATNPSNKGTLDIKKGSAKLTSCMKRKTPLVEKGNKIDSHNNTSPSTSTRGSTTPTTTAATRRRQNHTKTVSFSKDVHVKRTLSRRDYTIAEGHLSWYSGIEFLDIRKMCTKQITKMDAGEKLRDKKYCSRGLEGQTKLGYQARSKARCESIDAVLYAQEELQEEENQDQVDDIDEAIAFVYRQVTASRQLWATAVGLADARAAEDIDDILFDDDDCATTGNNHHQQSSIRPTASSSKRTTTTTTRTLRKHNPRSGPAKVGNNVHESTTTSGSQYSPRVRMHTMPKSYQAKAA